MNIDGGVFRSLGVVRGGAGALGLGRVEFSRCESRNIIVIFAPLKKSM